MSSPKENIVFSELERSIFTFLACMSFGTFYNIPARPKNCSRLELIEIIKSYCDRNHGVFLNKSETQVIKPHPKEWLGYHLELPQGDGKMKVA